jgi:hypothetical protein
VRGGVSGRQRNGDDEARRGEPQQRQDQRLSLPFGKKLLENQDAALTIGAHVRDAAVHRQGSEQRQDHEHQRRHRRERSCCQKRDARLIRERREIVDTGEAHHLPPVGGVPGPRVRTDRFGPALEKPAVESSLDRNCRRSRHYAGASTSFRCRQGSTDLERPSPVADATPNATAPGSHTAYDTRADCRSSGGFVNCEPPGSHSQSGIAGHNPEAVNHIPLPPSLACPVSTGEAV